jgi:hypothetical protein
MSGCVVCGLHMETFELRPEGRCHPDCVDRPIPPKDTREPWAYGEPTLFDIFKDENTRDERAEVFALRQRYWSQGYRPLDVWGPDQLVDDKGEPLKSPGKQPRGQWVKNANLDPPAAVRIQPDPRALNSGLLCGDIVGVDVDVLDTGIVDTIVSMIEGNAGPTPLVRVGRAPKTLLVYRAEQRFAKIKTPELFFPDGTKGQVELLAKGQQFVADGIHPDTGSAYRWTDRTPADFPLEELPVVTQEQCRALIAEAEQILRDAGAREKEKEAKPAREKLNGAAGGFFSQVNNAALTDIGAWAPALFPKKAQLEPVTGAWRVSSEDLGRKLQEDISIHPDGIQDFGEEEGLTPIDLVMRHHGDAESALDAALWICERLNIDPQALGYHSAPISLDDFVAYLPKHEYVFVPTRELWPASSVDGSLPPLPRLDGKGNQQVDAKGKALWIKPSEWLDRNRPVQQMTWAPGQPMLIEDRLVADGGWIDRRGARTFNLYREPIVEPGDPDGAQKWLELVHKLYPDDADHIIKWFAHRLQQPEQKLNHALVMGGAPGIGKDSIVEPVKRAVGHWNFSETSPQQVMGTFTGFLKSVIMRINEVRDLGEFDRFKFYDRTKSYIAAPPDVLRVNEKNLREYAVSTCAASS